MLFFLHICAICIVCYIMVVSRVFSIKIFQVPRISGKNEEQGCETCDKFFNPSLLTLI